MEPKVIRIEIKVTRTMVTVLAVLLLVALALLAVTSAGAYPPLEGPGGQGGVTLTSTVPITVPMMTSYQGQLLDRGGNPVPNGTYAMTFRLYNVASGGTAFWEETHPAVEVANGLFNVMLGVRIPFEPDDFIGTTYLGVTVGSDPEMTPRQRMVSVPYAFRAKKAESDDDWDGAGTGKMYPHYLNDNIGIGTTNPQEKLHVVGNVKIEGTSPVWTTLSSNPGADAGINLTTSAIGGNTWKLMRDGASADFLIKETFPYPPLSVDALTIKHFSGNVGIGMKAPQKMLDIRPPQGGYTDLGIRLDPNNAGFVGGTAWQIDNYNGVFQLVKYPPPPASPEVKFVVSNPIILNDTVGIQDDTPDAKLEVSADGQTTPDLFMLSSNDDGDGDRFIVKNNGNVGIGYTDPGSGKLSVNGRLQVGSNANVSGSLLDIYVKDADSSGDTGIYLDAPTTNSEAGITFSQNWTYRWKMYVPPSSTDLRFHSLPPVGDLVTLTRNGGGRVGIGTQNPTVKLDVVGDIHKTGTVSFVQPHPTDPTKEIVYVSLEGPEAGTYIRGTAQLVNGEAVINLPEHFSLVTNDEGLTVQLTPVGEWLQLYVVEKGTQRIIVREVNGKNGQFDYLVQGVRKGYENHQVIQERRQ